LFLNIQSSLRSTHRSNYISAEILTKSNRSIGNTKNCLYMLFGGATQLIPDVSINLPYE